MIKTIKESGMNFISDNSFIIEKSSVYTKLGDKVKSVEFVRVKGKKLLFIEAKSSFPKPDKADTTKVARFIEEVGAIYNKFTHSLNLYASINVGVTDESFPDDFKPADKMTLVFILVINGFELKWCDEIKRALSNCVQESICMAKIWKPEIYVINDKIAADHKITIGE